MVGRNKTIEECNFLLYFQRLIKRPDVMENIMSSLPGLSEDPVVVAILLDPNLLIHFSDVDTVRR